MYDLWARSEENKSTARQPQTGNPKAQKTAGAKVKRK